MEPYQLSPNVIVVEAFKSPHVTCGSYAISYCQWNVCWIDSKMQLKVWHEKKIPSKRVMIALDDNNFRLAEAHVLISFDLNIVSQTVKP